MEWTTKPPTEEGLWLVRRPEISSVQRQVINVFRKRKHLYVGWNKRSPLTIHQFMVKYADSQFAGPIPEPEETA